MVQIVFDRKFSSEYEPWRHEFISIGHNAIMLGIELYSGKGDPGIFMFSHICNHMRGVGIKRLERRLQREPLVPMPKGMNYVDDRLERSEEAQRLLDKVFENASNKKRTDWQEVFVAKYRDGLSFDEIADKFGWKNGNTAKSAIQQKHAELKERYKCLTK
jgi:hypothetical protein